MKEHRYETTVIWTGNRGRGTVEHAGYDRTFVVQAPGKPTIAGSSDPAFRGDAARWNPEELLLAALSACHKLWYLHLCAQAGIVVIDYLDRAEGTMMEEADGAGRFSTIVLHPEVMLAYGSDPQRAHALHAQASRMCFIERTVNCRVEHEPVIEVSPGA